MCSMWKEVSNSICTKPSYDWFWHDLLVLAAGAVGTVVRGTLVEEEEELVDGAVAAEK